MNSTPCFVTQIDLQLLEKLRAGLIAQGFQLTDPLPPHTILQGKKRGVSCTLYSSGKLTVQGKEKDAFIEFFLEPEILGTFSFRYTQTPVDFSPHIGVDESGKGDFFGPLCIAGVYADEERIKKLIQLGVKDSKQISSQTIVKLSQKIRALVPFHIVRIGPKKYNQLYETFGNLNLLLAWGHATVIDLLVEKTQCTRVLIDQFAAEHVVEQAMRRKKREVVLMQRPRGEEDVVVAAASILARSAFVEGLEQLEKTWACAFPKGASAQTITAGKHFVKIHSSGLLVEVGKLHFKTTHEILAS